MFGVCMTEVHTAHRLKYPCHRMFVCIFVCICVYLDVWIWMCVCMYAYMYMCVLCIWMCVSMYAYMYWQRYIHLCSYFTIAPHRLKYVHFDMYICIYVSKCIYLPYLCMYLYVYIYLYVCICRYDHIHLCSYFTIAPHRLKYPCNRELIWMIGSGSMQCNVV